MSEIFSRTRMLIGSESLECLANSKVAIFGIGGVGSFVAEGLVRAGVGNFVLIDDDEICETNINRQIHATTKTVGKAKVEVMRERMLDINPQVNVTVFKQFYLPETAEKLIPEKVDYIVDAIDTITGKIDLAVRAAEKNIPIISAMGAGNKLDPTRFEVADIFSTSVDPLARIMRKELRNRKIKKLKVVYSKEEPITLHNVIDKELSIDNIDLVGRRPPASISFVPSVVGLIVASEVVKDLIKQ